MLAIAYPLTSPGARLLASRKQEAQGLNLSRGGIVVRKEACKGVARARARSCAKQLASC